jgi:hypothetical protein
MTAIASLYVPAGFVMAADGRCKSDNPAVSTEFETEEAQKLFPIQDENRAFVYSLIGFAGTNDGKFKVVDEMRRVAMTLSNQRFDECESYIRKFCYHLQRILTKARRDGRISEFPPNEHLPLERRNNIFRLLIVGYFKQKPWQFEIRFVHDEKHRVHFLVDDASQLNQVTAAITGSDIVAHAMYTDRDPRFARYAKPYDVDTLDQASDYVRGYIEACADPVALELDPLCSGIGGHVHVAEITPLGGFKWRVAPLPFSV